MITREEIIEKAKGIGFCIVGFTHAGKMERIVEALHEREMYGYLSGMETGNLEERTCPGLHLEDARSIIAVGLPYVIMPAHCKDEYGCHAGVISGSAAGQDYHRLIKSGLEKLAGYISERVKGFRYCIMVDTGPLVDREVAYRAGIGWYGKNCSIICPGHGSGIFLGEMLVNIELETDTPCKEECGECSLCMKACPTGALESPYTLNARKCVSYLTQMRGMIPRELRTGMGTSIYGCDRCQQVCPSNIRTGGDNQRSNTVDLIELLKMDKEEFYGRFGKSAMAWRGMNVIKRNAVIALGNLGDEKGINILERVLEHPSPVLRAHAAWAIGKIGGSRAAEILQRILDSDEDCCARNEAALSLEELRSEQDIDGTFF